MTKESKVFIPKGRILKTTEEFPTLGDGPVA
jgi:hypothetical protein